MGRCQAAQWKQIQEKLALQADKQVPGVPTALFPVDKPGDRRWEAESGAVSPAGARNTEPGEVSCSMDVRHFHPGLLKGLVLKTCNQIYLSSLL